MLFVPQIACCHRWMVAIDDLSHQLRATRNWYGQSIGHRYLTCSLTSSVVPVRPSSFHLARKSSPRNAFNGFLTPSFSSRPAYCCCFKADRNHLSTSKARFRGFSSAAGATKMAGCSAQYAGYSTADLFARTKGGAVILERSPLIVAMD